MMVLKYYKTLKVGFDPPFLLVIMISSIEQKITEIIQETVHNLGFEVVKISIKGAKYKILEILIDRLDEQKVSISDCKAVSKNISTLLDIEDIFEGGYNLEISSVGIERPLVNFQNYARFIGNNVQIRLKELLNNCGHYRGTITSAENNIVTLKIKNEKLKDDEYLQIPFDIIKNGNLVMTEAMFRNLLNKKNK